MAPLLLLAAYLAITNVYRLGADRDRKALDLADSVLAVVDQDLQERIRGLQMLADPAATDVAHLPALYAQAQNFLRTYGTHVALADGRMQMLFNTRLPFGAALPPSLPPPEGDAAAPTALKTGKPAVGDIFMGPISRVPLVAIAVPVTQDGRDPLVIITAFETRQLAARIQQPGLPAEWALALLDSKGTALARRGPAQFGTGSDAPRRFVARSRIAPWSVVVEIPAADYRAPIIAASATLALAAMIATLAGAWGGISLSRRLARSLATLVEVSPPGAAAPAIAEIAVVRGFLDRAAENREITEVTLRNSEQRFRQLFQLAPLPLVLMEKTGVVVDANRCFTQVFEYTPAEVPTLDAWRLRAYPDADYRAWVVQTWNAALLNARKTGGSIGPLESRIHCKDGTVRSMMISGIDVGDDFLATFFDITERKRAEEALRAGQAAALNLMEDAQAARASAEAASASLRDLSQAVEQSSESIVICDLQGTIEYVNGACLRSSGYRREELIGKDVAMLRSLHSTKEAMESIRAGLAHGLTWKGEIQTRRKDGSEYTEFAIVSPLRQEDGRITRSVSVREDITEKKRLGQELDQHRHHLEELVDSRTAELEMARALADAANQAKSAFLANMSHEIRTPMNAIIGLSYLLRQEQLSAQQNDRLTKIDTAAQHLMSILNDILDLSKIEVGRLELENTDFPLASVLDGARALIADQAHAKGLVLKVDHDHVPLWLRGDPTRVRQAVLNFAGNAVKFTAQGTVWLRSKLLDETAGGLLVRFEVEDTGIGITADILPTLFKTFTQADTSTTRKFGGTGLGLAITRLLAQMMGGDAGGESTPGQGSTFWFTVRLQRGQPAGMRGGPPGGLDDAAEALRREHAGARILLAEDNPINREVARELLQRVNLAVDTAQNGLEALEKIKANRYVLVLMDVQMPEMDGLVATCAIRAQAEYAGLPILAMTANAFDEDRRACLAAGMDDFVAKPVVPKDLYITLLRWLSKPGVHSAPAGVRLPAAGPTPLPALPTPVAAPAFASLEARLYAIAGLDAARGLDIVGGDANELARFLRKFALSHAGDMQAVTRHVALGELQQAKQLTHGLKGVAATLGARQVADLAAQLEAAWYSAAPLADCQEIVRRCDAALMRLVAAINALPVQA
jgi:PAS domain S-box-containing protein